MLAASPASAHVKWFCAFDVAGQPRGLESVLCPDFELLVVTSILVLSAGCLLEGTILGDALTRALNRVTGIVDQHRDVVIRGACGFFLVALWSIGGILLTPELKTGSTVVPWLQLAMAGCLLWQATLPLAAAGIVGLFATAAYRYGLFHLMDYPVFLGLATYLALTGFGRTLFGVRPLDILRWTAAVTLMWASIEKWAYPEWTFPLFATHAHMAMGFDPEFFMRAAGTVEFALAFALTWTPLVRRAAAIMLAATFISAIGEFGKIDAVGHAPIIAALIAIAADQHRSKAMAPIRSLLPSRTSMRSVALAPVAYCLALTAFLALYYVTHALLFGTTII